MAIIVLDPGHGLGSDGHYKRSLLDCRGDKVEVVGGGRPHPMDLAPGYYREDLGTLAIARMCEDALINMGHVVHMTRQDEHDAAVHLSQFANSKWRKARWKWHEWIKEAVLRTDASIFVSIHTNALPVEKRGKARGCVGIYSGIGGRRLSRHIVDEIHDATGIPVRGVRRSRQMKVLRGNVAKYACIAECCFHDNIEDMRCLLSPHGFSSVATGIANGIAKLLEEIE